MEPEEEEHREDPERPEREEAGGACADLPARTVGAEPLGPLWAGKCMGRKAEGQKGRQIQIYQILKEFMERIAGKKGGRWRETGTGCT